MSALHPLTLVAVLIAAVSGAAAQEVSRLPVAGKFSEHFSSGPVKVSGVLVVGVLLGRLDFAFTPANLQVDLITRPLSGKLCLSVNSRDGRYSAENLYDIPAKIARNSGFEFQSAHLAQIGAYSHADMAVLVRDVADCTSREFGVVLPNLISSSDQRDHLTFFINGVPERVSVRMSGPSGAFGVAQPCIGKRDATSIAFSAQCSVLLPAGPLGGVYEAEISLRERFETMKRTIQIRIDRP